MSCKARSVKWDSYIKCAFILPIHALAQEVTKIQSELIKLRLFQDNYGEDTATPPLKSREHYENYRDWVEARENVDFLGVWLMCARYSSSFLCNIYKTPTGSWGRIIIILDSIYPNEIFNLKSELSDFNSQQLRQLHSYKVHKIKKRHEIFCLYM